MYQRTRIKICGLTRADDLHTAISLGVDAIGLVSCERSKRHLGLDQGVQLAQIVPGFTSLVALFLNPEPEQVRHVIDAWKPDVLQFHGEENAEFCRSFNRRYIKAVAMDQQGEPLKSAHAAYPDAAGYLVDSHAPGALGGQGLSFDWSRLAGQDQDLILAGGLNPDNVAQAIRTVSPWAVDVSSGVEDSPGIKSDVKMHSFVAAVSAADDSQRAADE